MVDLKALINGSSLRLSFDTAVIPIGGESVENSRFKGEIISKNGGFFLSGALSFLLIFNCDRCAESSSKEISVNINEQISKDGDFPLSPDYMFDLDSALSQLLTLSIPVKLLCSDECRGVCFGCGVNLNRQKCECKAVCADARWEKLEEFLD